jgi:hypothetical protein
MMLYLTSPAIAGDKLKIYGVETLNNLRGSKHYQRNLAWMVSLHHKVAIKSLLLKQLRSSYSRSLPIVSWSKAYIYFWKLEAVVQQTPHDTATSSLHRAHFQLHGSDVGVYASFWACWSAIIGAYPLCIRPRLFGLLVIIPTVIIRTAKKLVRVLSKCAFHSSSYATYVFPLRYLCSKPITAQPFPSRTFPFTFHLFINLPSSPFYSSISLNKQVRKLYRYSHFASGELLYLHIPPIPPNCGVGTLLARAAPEWSTLRPWLKPRIFVKDKTDPRLTVATTHRPRPRISCDNLNTVLRIVSIFISTARQHLNF